MNEDVEALKEHIKRLEEENKLLREDAAFKPIFDGSPLGIFRTTSNGKFLKVNQTLCDILNYENPKDLINSVDDIATDVYAFTEDREKVLRLLDNSKNYARFEIEFKRKNGEVFTGFMSAKLVKDGNGAVKYIEGTAEDISEYKQAEIEKKKSDNLYRTVINTISDTIVISDISGMIEYVSPSVMELVSTMSSEKLIGSNILGWLDEKYHQKAKENIHKILNNQPHNFEEYELIKDDGERIIVEIRTSVLKDDRGNPYKLVSLIRDISNRKKTELILRQTQDLYRTIIELSPAGILISYQGEILFLNTALAGIFDTVNQWDLIGKQVKDLIKKEFKKEINKILSDIESARQLKAFSQVQIISTKDILKDVQLSASPIFYDGKKCTFLFVNDITERVRVEKELKKEKQLMDTFWDHVPDCITFKNHKGEYIRVNDRFLRWTGVKDKNDVLGKSDYDIFGSQHYRISRREEKNVMNKGEIIVNESREELWPDNKKRWVMLTKMPLFDLDQNIVGIFSMTRDITKEKNSELEIRDREKWFRYIFDNSPVAKIITDKQHRIKRINRSVEDLLEFNSDLLINKSLYNVFPVDDRKLIREEVNSISEVENKTFQLELRICNSKNELKSVIVQGVNLKDTGGQYGDFLIHLIDIHKRKLAEDLLLVRNTELNNFVYKVSHDLRAPLTSIKGLINLIKLENDPAVFDEYMQMISGRVERLDSFIRDVLSHSKNLNVKIKIEKVDLKEIVNDCLARVAYHTSSSKVTLLISIKGKEFYSDYQRVHEILRNLISNAYQYSKRNSKNSFVKIAIKTTLKYTLIVVEDNGIGIKKRYQPRIFDMFYRANEKVEGSGLGLYIVKLSVENLKGEIKFSSAMNKGTRFEINLPNHYPK